MKAAANPSNQPHQSKANANHTSGQPSPQRVSLLPPNAETFLFEDKRPEAVVQRQLQALANNSPQVQRLRAIQEMANKSVRKKQAAQLHTRANNHVARTAQRQEKVGEEERLQGTDIHRSPGQEKHRPHEARQVVQRKLIYSGAKMGEALAAATPEGIAETAGTPPSRIQNALESLQLPNLAAILGQEMVAYGEAMGLEGENVNYMVGHAMNIPNLGWDWEENDPEQIVAALVSSGIKAGSLLKMIACTGGQGLSQEVSQGLKDQGKEGISVVAPTGIAHATEAGIAGYKSDTEMSGPGYRGVDDPELLETLNRIRTKRLAQVSKARRQLVRALADENAEEVATHAERIKQLISALFNEVIQIVMETRDPEMNPYATAPTDPYATLPTEGWVKFLDGEAADMESADILSGISMGPVESAERVIESAGEEKSD